MYEQNRMSFFFPLCDKCGAIGKVLIFTYSPNGSQIGASQCEECDRLYIAVLRPEIIEKAVEMAKGGGLTSMQDVFYELLAALKDAHDSIGNGDDLADEIEEFLDKEENQ